MLRLLAQPTKARIPLRCFSAPAFENSNHQHGTSEQHPPPLKKIPSLPIVGSQLSLFSGIPAIDLQDMNNYWRRLHREHGPFYSVGVPGFGQGIHGTLYVVRDVHEMLKVLRQEGTYPSGAIEQEWPTIAWYKKRKFSSIGLFQQGEEWKRLRSFVQKDLLAPASAREYLPYILQGSKLASSKYRPGMDLNEFTSYAALDMFAGVLFGGQETMKDDYEEFCNAAVGAFEDVVKLMLGPTEIAAHKMGFETKTLCDYFGKLDHIQDIAARTLNRFADHIDSGDASESERNSYFYKLLQREPGSEVSREEIIEMCVILMIAAVDTTATKSSWNLLQLSLNPEVQKEVHEQVRRGVDQEGDLTPNVIFNSPLLAAFVRETHRCTPAIFGDIFKKVSAPTEIYGTTLPADSIIMFDCLTNQMDPELVQDPTKFDPHRWLPEAVAARKNTPAAIIDHPFYSGPFSQGARRCPGSRVANLEVQTFLARLLLDYKIEGPSSHWSEVPGKLRVLTVPDFPKEVQLVPRS